MLGLFIAAIMAMVNFFHHQTLEVMYLNSTHFLFHWYIITSVILAVIVVLVALGVIGAATVGGGILGFLGSAAASIFGIIVFVFKRGLFIFGSYLLSHALVMSGAAAQWDTTKLIVGCIAMFIAISLRTSLNVNTSH